MRDILDTYGAHLAPRRPRRRHDGHRRAPAGDLHFPPELNRADHRYDPPGHPGCRLMRAPLSKDTRLCISLAAPAQQYRHPVPQLPVRPARAGLHLQGVHHHRHRRRDRRCARTRHPRLFGLDAFQGGRHRAGRRRGALGALHPLGQHNRQRRRPPHARRTPITLRSNGSSASTDCSRSCRFSFAAAVGWPARSVPRSVTTDSPTARSSPGTPRPDGCWQTGWATSTHPTSDPAPRT